MESEERAVEDQNGTPESETWEENEEYGFAVMAETEPQSSKQRHGDTTPPGGLRP
jgi:hypothetical protein